MTHVSSETGYLQDWLIEILFHLYRLGLRGRHQVETNRVGEKKPITQRR